MSNNVRTRDGLPFNFEDGLKVNGIFLSDYFTINPIVATTDRNIAASDKIIICRPGIQTLTLPSIITSVYKMFLVINRSGSNVTINTTNGELIDSTTSKILANNSNATFYNDGITWLLLT